MESNRSFRMEIPMQSMPSLNKFDMRTKVWFLRGWLSVRGLYWLDDSDKERGRDSTSIVSILRLHFL